MVKKNKQLPESPDTGRESYCTVLRIGGLQGDPARPLVPTAGVAAGVRRGGGPLPPHHQVLEVGIHRAIPAQDGEFSNKINNVHASLSSLRIGGHVWRPL